MLLTGGVVGKEDIVGLKDGGNVGTDDGLSENEGTKLGIADTDGATEIVGSMFCIGACEIPPFGAVEIVGAGEIVGNTDVVGSIDGRSVGAIDGRFDMLGVCDVVDGLRLVVGSMLGIGLTVGAFDTVGSSV
jgi:hypothetical protein